MRPLVPALLVVVMLAGCGTTGDRAVPADALRDTAPDVEVHRDWKRRAGSGIESEGERVGPVLFDDVLYVADRRGRISGYHAERGRREWRARVGMAIAGGPGVNDDLVVVGTRSGNVVAVDRDGSETLWETRVRGEILAVPLVTDRVVAVRASNGRVYGLHPDTGEQLWVNESSVPTLSLRGLGNPAFDGSLIFVGLENGRLRALNPRDGNTEWERTISEARGSADLDRVRDVDGTPVVRDGTLYVAGYRGTLMGLATQRGEVRWDRDFSSHADLAVDEERLYATDDRGRVWALDRRTGAAIWRQDDTEGLEATGPAVYGDKVVIGDARGRLTVLSARDGHILGRVRVREDDSISATPVVHAEGVHALTDDGFLVRYRFLPVDDDEDDRGQDNG